MAAVAFGVGFQIPNSANLAGYSRELLSQGMQRATGHVTITSPTVDWPEDVEQTIAKLEALQCVEHVATRLIQGAVVLRQDVSIPARHPGIRLRDADFLR